MPTWRDNSNATAAQELWEGHAPYSQLAQACLGMAFGRVEGSRVYHQGRPGLSPVGNGRPHIHQVAHKLVRIAGLSQWEHLVISAGDLGSNPDILTGAS